MRASLPISAGGHAAIIGLLLLLPVAMPPPKLDMPNAISVVFAQPAPPTPPPPAPSPPVEAAPPAPEPPPPPVVEQPPPMPPPPPAPVAETPPPPPPAPKPPPKPRPKPQPVERPAEIPMPLPAPAPAAIPAAPPQLAAIPRPAPVPAITADYRSMLSSWLESHKRYPEEARQRGEEGRAVLRFRIARSGQVLDYAVVSSTGYADLDASLQAMMRGAAMPPFPPSMTAPEIEVSVTIRFGLQR